LRVHDNSYSVNKLDIMSISNNLLISIFITDMTIWYFINQGGSCNKTQTGLVELDKMRDNFIVIRFQRND